MLDFCSKHNIVCDIERINIDSVNEAMVGGGQAGGRTGGRAGVGVALQEWLSNNEVHATSHAECCFNLLRPVFALPCPALPCCAAGKQRHACHFTSCLLLQLSAPCVCPSLPALQVRLANNDVHAGTTSDT